jgi:hypothetical protein
VNYLAARFLEFLSLAPISVVPLQVSESCGEAKGIEKMYKRCDQMLKKFLEIVFISLFQIYSDRTKQRLSSASWSVMNLS